MREEELADPKDLPNGLNEKARQHLIRYIKRRKEQHRLSDQQMDQWSRTSSKVSVELCETIQRLKDDGMSASEIVDFTPIESRNTVYYHLRGDCKHEQRSMITHSECGWMRFKARKGASSKVLAMLYNVSPKAVTIHVTGKCGHSHGCETVSGSELQSNAFDSASMETSLCEVCGTEFEHKEYRDRTTCSKACNGKYASMKAAQSETASD